MQTARNLPRLAFGKAAPGLRALPEEVAVAISYNGTTQAVMMATPADLQDFAYGFSATEGIAQPAEIDSVTVQDTDAGIDLQIWLHRPAEARLTQRRRSMAGPVGCGLCGIDSLAEATRSPAPVPQSTLQLTPSQVMQAASDLVKHQPLHDATHAVHAAGFWTPKAGMIAAREDVGRHNALDKLVGALRQPHPAGAVVLTSRVSIDLVQKCAALGAPVLIAVSAPTAAAVSMAEVAGITLIALARPDRFEVFTHPQRITAEAADVA
ncbi:formate dehydrogenase accessory sulfurtransferase FdhD [Rhodobacter ferrooxidans]|uniref:Sulfur carrier protein FdhD n=1 Tax=Rhodobacter ferrooxidans TaxID=371731 RepID=C8S2Z7_9RHOB|nr:formate dehydrogenase accessory sulfurtransferase FdhD [Rhodobacter sp. SW2]EEW24637.1 formate dehydrogenase family accessory protein FdhD [Rhodobacter sp. SW2]